MDAYAVVTVQSGCSSTLALLASLVIRLFSMLVCLWCQRPQGAMRMLIFLWAWGVGGVGCSTDYYAGAWRKTVTGNVLNKLGKNCD